MEKNHIAVCYGDNPFETTKRLMLDIDLAGIIKKGLAIGIKPNLVVAKPASDGATTHPEIVAAVIEHLKSGGHDNIVILEGSWIGESTKRAWDVCGYRELSAKYNVPLIDTKDDKTQIKSAGGLSMEICKSALELDFLINIPVLKGHCQTRITGAMKNLKGCISDSEKRNFHMQGLHKPIAYLNKLLPSSFIIVDGICGDLDFEEGGNPVTMNRIICGVDCVLVDSYLASCMGYSPSDIEHINIANSIGVGSSNLEDANITVLGKDKSPVNAVPTGKVKKLACYVDEDKACSACYANLIRALKRFETSGLLGKFSKKSICIGQGFKNKTGAIGIGKCTANCDVHISGCPPHTSDIVSFLKNHI